jgi:hypothetical protein
MQTLVQLPPNYEEIKKSFDFDKKNTVFTFGANLYNPSDIKITDDLAIHEWIHSKQQEQDDTVAKLWWRRYLQDKEFRLSQELEAYGSQYAYILMKIKDRNKQDKYLRAFAQMLSSPMYGNVITASEALKAIKLQATK